MQLFSLVVHGLLVLLILLAPWPDSYTALWLGLVTLVVFGFIRSQRNIKVRQGRLLCAEQRTCAGSSGTGRLSNVRGC